MQVGAVVVHHDLPSAALERCLDALLATEGLGPVLLVHNGPDGADLPDRGGRVEVVRTVNRGYGAAADLGLFRLVAAGCDPVALLNDDVVVEPGWLAPLVDALAADRGLGGVQPTLRFADGDPPVVNSTGVVLGTDGAGRDRHLGEPDRPGLGGGEVDAITGGAALYRADFLHDVGGFDHRYGMYYEDVDLCLRGRERGWRFAHVPASTVRHAQGGSAGSDVAPGTRDGGGRSRSTVFVQERNRLWCAYRFADPATMCRATWLSVRRLRHDPRDVHRRALVAGVAGLPSRLVERRRARRGRWEYVSGGRPSSPA